MQFPPETLCISSRFLIIYNIIQTLVVLSYIIDIAIVANGFEMKIGALYLALLRAAELAILQVIVLGFCHEIDVFDTAFSNCNNPVRIVLSLGE